MRIWDISPRLLCQKHLIAEHRELHAVYSVILNSKKGYSKHPETLRWYGKLPALYKRHELLVSEMKKRNYKHKSPLIKTKGSSFQKKFINTKIEQFKILKKKKCKCLLK